MTVSTGARVAPAGGGEGIGPASPGERNVSRSLGPHLPDALLARLAGPHASAPLDGVVILTTVDPYGWPHPALLSYAEVAALDAVRLRLGLHAGSRSARHITDTGRATLVFADAELIFYVRAEAVSLPEAPGHVGLARFELHVRDVLEDRAEGEEAGARLTGGLTVAWPGGLEAAARRHARIRLALLA